MKIITSASVALATLLGLHVPTYSHDSSAAWRVVPIASPHVSTSIGAFERCVNAVLTLNCRSIEGMPLYESNAPRKIFIFDTDENNQLIVSRIDFIHKGLISKAPARDIIDYFQNEPQLQECIRATTGIKHPQGFICRHGSEVANGMSVGIDYIMSSEANFSVEFLCYILKSAAFFRYKPSHSTCLRNAVQRPCIFVSSRVTDSMLLQEFAKIPWQIIESHATKYWKISGQHMSRLRKTYNQFHRELEKIQAIPRAYNDVLCIA